MMMENNEDYLTEEMEKQKKKLRDIGNVLDSQHQLLRLIIQVSRKTSLNYCRHEIFDKFFLFGHSENGNQNRSWWCWRRRFVERIQINNCMYSTKLTMELTVDTQEIEACNEFH